MYLGALASVIPDSEDDLPRLQARVVAAMSELAAAKLTLLAGQPDNDKTKEMPK